MYTLSESLLTTASRVDGPVEPRGRQDALVGGVALHERVGALPHPFAAVHHHDLATGGPRSSAARRPIRPHPQTTTWSVNWSMSRSIRRLRRWSVMRPSMSVSRVTVRVYSTVPAPTRISTMVKTFQAPVDSPTSRNPTVETVVIVW